MVKNEQSLVDDLRIDLNAFYLLKITPISTSLAISVVHIFLVFAYMYRDDGPLWLSIIFSIPFLAWPLHGFFKRDAAIKKTAHAAYILSNAGYKIYSDNGDNLKATLELKPWMYPVEIQKCRTKKELLYLLQDLRINYSNFPDRQTYD